MAGVTVIVQGDIDDTDIACYTVITMKNNVSTISTKAHNIRLQLERFGSVQRVESNASACDELVAAGLATSELWTDRTPLGRRVVGHTIKAVSK